MIAHVAPCPEPGGHASGRRASLCACVSGSVPSSGDVGGLLHRVGAAERRLGILVAILAGSCPPSVGPFSHRPLLERGGRGVQQAGQRARQPSPAARPRARRASVTVARSEVAVHPRDDVDADLLRARRLALAEVRAVAEALGVHLRDHRERTAVALGLALRQEAEVRDLRGGEQHRRAVRARRDAGAAADAGRRVHRGVRHPPSGSGSRWRPARCPVGAEMKPPACDDAVERAAVDDEVLDHRERPRAPRLDADLVAVLEAGACAAGRSSCRAPGRARRR